MINQYQYFIGEINHPDHPRAPYDTKCTESYCPHFIDRHTSLYPHFVYYCASHEMLLSENTSSHSNYLSKTEHYSKIPRSITDVNAHYSFGEETLQEVFGSPLDITHDHTPLYYNRRIYQPLRPRVQFQI